MTEMMPVTEADLHAYVDGQLDPDRRAAIEAHLKDDPETAERIADYRRQNEGLRALFGGVADTPVPTALTPAAALARRRDRRRATLARSAAAVVLLAIGAGGGWLLNDVLRIGPAPLVASLSDEAAAAHRMYAAERRHAVEVAAEEEHLFRWLSNRLGDDVRAPALDAMGFRLMGGRLLPSGGGPAAQFMYQDAAEQRLTLYIRLDPGSEETQFEYASEDGTGAFYWVEGRFGYALVGEMPRESLLRAARFVYLDLSG